MILSQDQKKSSTLTGRLPISSTKIMYQKTAESAFPSLDAKSGNEISRNRDECMNQEVKRIEKSIQHYSTSELVEELKTRRGVEIQMAEPHRDMEIKVSGPATVLVVID